MISTFANTSQSVAVGSDQHAIEKLDGASTQRFTVERRQPLLVVGEKEQFGAGRPVDRQRTP
jgi:hypothetical protein